MAAAHLPRARRAPAMKLATRAPAHDRRAARSATARAAARQAPRERVPQRHPQVRHARELGPLGTPREPRQGEDGRGLVGAEPGELAGDRGAKPVERRKQARLARARSRDIGPRGRPPPRYRRRTVELAGDAGVCWGRFYSASPTRMCVHVRYTSNIQLVGLTPADPCIPCTADQVSRTYVHRPASRTTSQWATPSRSSRRTSFRPSATRA